MYVLFTCLYIKEVDETWTWDVLFTDVSSDMMTEWFPDPEPSSPSVKENIRFSTLSMPLF